MIFDIDSDRALWAMMAGCSEKRNDIAYFISTLPNEIIMDVRRALEDKKHGFFDNDSYGFDRFCRLICDECGFIERMRGYEKFNY
jgi:hypothetical protein